MNLSKYEENILGLLKNFFSDKKNVLFAYWYGSRNEYTDIDIAVFISPEELHTKSFFDLDLATEITKLVHKDVDVIVLNNAHLEMRYAAQKGVLVFERNKKLRIEFEVRTRLEYWDFVPILKIYMETARKKLRKLFPEVYQRLDAARNK